MKIALVSPHTLPVYRGNSLTAQRLHDGLFHRGHMVRLFNSATDTPNVLIAFSPDVVHSLHALHPQDWLQQFGLPGTCPRVVTLTGTEYNSTAAPNALAALSDARALIVFHAEAAAYVRARYPDLADRVNVIPQSVQVPEPVDSCRSVVRRKWKLAPDEVVIFMAAGLRPVKNILYGLEAFSIFKQKHPLARLLL